MESPTPTDPPPIAHVEFKAVMLLAAIAAVICGFVLYVAYARGVFEPTQQLILKSDDSEGILVGMDLTFSGFPIGRVRRIELDADGKARIVIDVPRKEAHWLRSSSIFTMERGLVGDTRIRAYSGVLTDPVLPENSERGVLRGDSNAEIPRLIASARALLNNLENMTGPNSSINTSLANLNTVTERLTGRYGVLTGVLGSEENASKIMTALERSNTLLAKADQHVFGAHGLVEGTQATLASTRATLGSAQAAAEEVRSLLTDTRASLKKVDAVLAEAQAVGANVRLASTDLGALRAEVELSLHKVSTLMDEVNRKWPFARDAEIRLP